MYNFPRFRSAHLLQRGVSFLGIGRRACSRAIMAYHHTTAAAVVPSPERTENFMAAPVVCDSTRRRAIVKHSAALQLTASFAVSAPGLRQLNTRAILTSSPRSTDRAPSWARQETEAAPPTPRLNVLVCTLSRPLGRIPPASNAHALPLQSTRTHSQLLAIPVLVPVLVPATP